MSTQKLTNVFTYGSLMYKEVIGKLVKQTYQSQRALLKNYERRHVKNVVYPGVIRCQGKQVAGVVHYGVSEQDLVTLDYFESQQYEKDEVQVVAQSGTIVNAIVYRYVNPSNLEDEEWRIDEFQKMHKFKFADNHIEVKTNGSNLVSIQQENQKTATELNQ